MSGYKEAALEMIDLISKKYFSESRSAEEEEFASALFNKFRFQIKEQDDIKTMFMLLKIMVAEGIMLHGTRRLENPKTDA